MPMVTALNHIDLERPPFTDLGRPTVIPIGELVYGLVIAVDIQSFSRLDTLDQSLAQEQLRDVLDLAAQKSGLDRESWYRQPRGDGELAVLPSDTDVAWVVARFTDQLVDALRGLRSGADRSDLTLRLRVSPIVASRLLDSPMVRRTLSTETAVDLVLVISERLYHDVVRTRFHGLAADRFRPMRMSLKGVTYVGYVCAGTPLTPGDTGDTGDGWTGGRHAG